MIHHASYSARATGASSELSARAPQDQDVAADIRKAAILTAQMLDGIDIDGNETIDPIAGEGGAITAIEHAEYMSDMVIVPEEDQASSP